MKKLINHMILKTLGILLVVLAMAISAKAQITIDQCDTMEFSVVSRPGIDESHFVWGIYNSSPDPTDVLDPTNTLDPALYFVDGQYAGRTVSVTGLDPGIYYVRIHVWDEINCTDNIEMYVLEVVENIPEVLVDADSVCIGDPTTITIIFTGVGPYTIDYTYGDALSGTYVNVNGVIVDGPEVTIPILYPFGAGNYEFMIDQIEDECKTHLYDEADKPRTGVVIYPKPTNSRIYQQDN
jgi:hypothetical protein